MTSMNEQFANALKGMFPMAALAPNQMPNMFPLNEQMTSLIKANIDAQISVATSMTTTAVDSLQKIVELNINAARASLEDSSAVTRQLMSARDPQEFVSLTVAQAQPTMAKALSYGRHLADIATTAQDTLARATAEQISDASNRMHELVDNAAKNAPAGSGNVVEMMKMAMNTASANYQRMNRTARQAAEQTQANMDAAINQFAHAADPSSGGTGRARKH